SHRRSGEICAARAVLPVAAMRFRLDRGGQHPRRGRAMGEIPDDRGAVARGVGQGLMLFPTTLVGSYPQPDWLIDRASLAKQMPPRVRAKELWRVEPERLDAAQDEATLIAIRDQERAGLDIVSDGEQRRESYSNRFATALDGVDLDN